MGVITGGQVRAAAADASTCLSPAVSTPNERKGHPVGSASRHGCQGGGMEEATVGLHQEGPWSREEFALLLRDLHRFHYPKLVKLAAIWLDGAGEDAVQDAFVDVWSRREHIRDPDKVLLYLRRAVVNRAMSELRHRRVARRLLPPPPAWGSTSTDEGRLLWSTTPSGTEEEALSHVGDQAIVCCLRRLSRQQGASVALRFYLDLSEKEIADVLRCSTGAVKKHTSRAMARLRPLLETNDD